MGAARRAAAERQDGAQDGRTSSAKGCPVAGAAPRPHADATVGRALGRASGSTRVEGPTARAASTSSKDGPPAQHARRQHARRHRCTESRLAGTNGDAQPRWREAEQPPVQPARWRVHAGARTFGPCLLDTRWHDGRCTTWESRRSVANRRATRAEAARGEGTDGPHTTSAEALDLFAAPNEARGTGARRRSARGSIPSVNGSFRPLSVESKQCPRRRYRYCSSRGCLQATAGWSPDAVQPPSHRHTVTPCFKSGLAFRKNGRSP